MHTLRTELECMRKERKNESKKTSVGKDCDCSVLELVDGFCTSLFGENCSRMADYNLPHFWIYETTVPFYFLKTQYSFERKRTIVIYMITSICVARVRVSGISHVLTRFRHG